MFKRITYLITFLLFTNGIYAQTNVDSISNLTYPFFVNDVWGYVSPDGIEYALVGTSEGVSIVSLATPENPTEVAFVSGSRSSWRDMKTWGQRAYVTTEAADGLLVIDLAGLPNEVNHYFWNPTIEGIPDTFRTCHNLYIDENGYCYLSGSNLNNGGFIIADIFTNPDTPSVVGLGPPAYSHDIFVRDNIAYSSDIEAGVLSMHDVTDKDSIQFMGMLETPFRWTHNAWLSDDSKIVFTTDELENAPTAAYDISDLSDIKELDQFRPSATIGQGVIPHNVHYHNGYLVISHYGDGVVIVDANRPDNLVEVGNYDTSLGVAGFTGAWGAYPYLPSGLVLVSDSENGLFVVKPNYTRAAYLEGVITDASTGEGLFGATVTVGTTQATSGLAGEVKTGTPDAGMVEVTISKRGYISQTVQVEMVNGEITPIEVSLSVAPTYTVSGLTVVNENGQAIEGVNVNLVDGEFVEQAQSNGDGNFTFENVLASNYTLVAGKWGYAPILMEGVAISGDDNSLMIELQESIEDPFLLDLGWTVTDENIFVGGGFELGTPIFSPQIPFISNDVPDDLGTSCFSTAIRGSIPDNVFVAGRSVLTSPEFDLSNMMTPTISYSTIYGNVIFTATELLNGVDTFKVFLSNGTDRVLVDTLTNDADVTTFALPDWRESIINVKDFLTPTATMTISFEVSSDSFESVAEAGVDNFKAFDGGTVSVNDYIKEDLNLSVSPNPFDQQITIQYNASQWQEKPMVVLFDGLGRTVYQQPMPNNQQIELSNTIQSGIYFLQLRTTEKGSKVLKVVKH